MRHFLPALLLLASGAHAAPPMAVLAAGRCEDAELLDLASDLSRALATRRAPGEVLPDDAVRARVGALEASPLEASPIDALRLRLNAAKTLFYNGALNRADERLAELAREVTLLAPGTERVALEAETHVLRAMTFRNLDRLTAGDDELRQVLRLNPSFTLDPDDYSPTLRARLERVRGELARAPRQTLRVVSEPPGATVFVDGHALGKTPFEKSLPLGAYTVVLGLHEKTSFPRSVRLEKPGPTALRIDAGFETGVNTRGFSCLEEAPGQEGRVANAIKLAILLDVQEVVLVRLAHAPAHSRWLSASVVDTRIAQRVREGAIQIERDVPARQTALEDLARFVFTGQGERVRPVFIAPLHDTGAPLVVDTPLRRERTGKTPAGIAAAGLGGAAAVAGTVLAFQSAATWRRFDAFYPSADQAPAPSQIPEVLALRRQAERERLWAGVSLGVAAAAGLTGAALILLDGRATAAEAQPLRPLAGPGYVGVTGGLP